MSVKKRKGHTVSTHQERDRSERPKRPSSWARKVLVDSNAAYTRILSDPKASAELHAEREEWEVTLEDGLENDPYP